MASMQRFVIDGGSTTGYVIWAHNHLNQRRQFAFDGRYWFYQPTTRSSFIKVNPRDLPKNAVSAMSDHAGMDMSALLKTEYI